MPHPKVFQNRKVGLPCVMGRSPPGLQDCQFTLNIHAIVEGKGPWIHWGPVGWFGGKIVRIWAVSGPVGREGVTEGEQRARNAVGGVANKDLFTSEVAGDAADAKFFDTLDIYLNGRSVLGCITGQGFR